CFIMNVEDTHLINYSLKKLQNLGVVQSSRSGKDVTYATTETGRQYVERYREIREACLINALKADDALNQQIGELARLSDTPVDTVRYYEKAGLMPVPPRSDANYRRYDDTHVARLRFIRHCRALDLSLDEIRTLLRVRDDP
ncbi:MerR family transcriptional regulator, partial [Vibrio parahaemolyticus]|uniref:MerR family transcriptional regulator n=1 Tax=Vibrio parahaemolyticus TaxID=670 RepID=UPI001BAF683D